MKHVPASEYVRASDVRRVYKISPATLRAWGDTGRVACRRIQSGRRMYRMQDFHAIFQSTSANNPVEEEEKEGIKYVYARVSSSHQKEDLQRQVADLQSRYPDHTVVQDVGSGLNWKRKGLRTILERTFQGDVSEVVVAHADRLARFAVDLLAWIFRVHGVRLVVLDSCTESRYHADELADDLVAVTTFFVARSNGRRSAQHKRLRQQASAGQSEPSSRASAQNKAGEAPRTGQEVPREVDQPPRKRKRSGQAPGNKLLGHQATAQHDTQDPHDAKASAAACAE